MRVQTMPAAVLPHISRLALDHLTDFEKVSRFYGGAPFAREWRDLKPAGKADRTAVAKLLVGQNEKWGAGEKSLSNIARLRDGAGAIVTGQQVGILGGPLYSILKAVTAIKLAEEASAAGHPAVPIFWLATEDHDLAEVSFTKLPGERFAPQQLKVTAHPPVDDAPVGQVKFGDEVSELIADATKLLGESDASRWLREAYQPKVTFGDAFARFFTQLFRDHGLIIMDPSATGFHRLGADLMLNAVRLAPEMNQSLLKRNAELEAAGYHAQVKVTPTSTLLFDCRSGSRRPIHLSKEGFVADGERLNREKLMSLIAESPEAFSANALLRPVWQDFLLPTLAYVGGLAEVSYFAQSQVVYQSLLGGATAIIPRISATIVEAKVARKLGQLGISAADIWQGSVALSKQVATRKLPQELHSAFADAEGEVRRSVSHLQSLLKRLDPTLADAAERSSSKMNYQLHRLKNRTLLAEGRRNREVSAHIAAVSDALFPEENLQEREIAGAYFAARYGPDLIPFLKRHLSAAEPGHQFLFMDS